MKHRSNLLLVFFAVFATLYCDAQGLPADQKLRLAELIIEKNYVDHVNTDTIVDEAIRAMLKTLDPHSSYSTPEETRDLTEPLEGNFSGIGISFNMVKDSVYVIDLISGGPAERVGMRPGDRIISADGVALSGVKMKTTDIRRHIRGPKGSFVNIAVMRSGNKTPIQFKISRDNIPVYSVDATYMIDNTTGYIRLSRFAADSDKEIRDAMEKLTRQGMKNLIFDLQSNGGGYLHSAVKIADLFMPKNKLIVYTDGPHIRRQDFNTSSSSEFKGRIVVLVDQYSASASEILAGAIQDYDRGVIIGRRTFGKGLVQRPFPFPDGSMIRLTTSRYYTPSGRCIQKPYVEGKGDKYREDMLNRYKSGEFSSIDSIHMPDSLRFSTINRHRTVYGGGGIMPDRFVPIDTTDFSTYYSKLVNSGSINQFSIAYVDRHRQELRAKYTTINNYINNFVVTDDMLNQLIERASTEDKIDFAEEDFARSKSYIALIVKAYIARDIFSSSDYFHIVNPHNPIFKEAVKLINSPTDYNNLLK